MQVCGRLVRPRRASTAFIIGPGKAPPLERGTIGLIHIDIGPIDLKPFIANTFGELKEFYYIRVENEGGFSSSTQFPIY